MFYRKWQWALVALIIMSVGGFMFLRPTTPPEPIKIYSAVTPTPKPVSTAQTDMEKTNITAQHGDAPDPSHGHSHEPIPHFHGEAANTKSGEYDWQDDGEFDVTLPKSAPWKQLYPEGDSTEDIDEDTHPPRGWFKTTTDPALFAEYFRAQLIKQFGDIPEVHTLADIELKTRSQIPLTQDEMIRNLEATYSLWPDPRTLKTLERLRHKIADGTPIVFRQKDPPR